MSDTDITAYDPGEHGIDYGRQSWHVDAPDTTLAIGYCMEAISQKHPRGTGDLRFLVSIHGYPSRGSKGDKDFRPGNHRVYSQYVSKRTLQNISQQGLFVLRPERSAYKTEQGYEKAYRGWLAQIMQGQEDILDFANQSMRVNGMGTWRSVDGLTIALEPPMGS